MRCPKTQKVNPNDMIKSVRAVKNKEMGYLKSSKGFGYLPPPVQVQNAAEALSWMIHLLKKAAKANALFCTGRFSEDKKDGKRAKCNH
ncbi:unnamed protein product [Acanthoscelides obtectus]|uniref:Uncharacterized protein n=1 Tax=Acanthoscelides obtectus TaxID=200917 RepID=A0A9P0LCQ3_ACAOB|nr:unnamed protein product [Acanthoscelides obtectus]CAK1643281.1 hypothetical protein AOBTE_LOCUS13476 [Acanthoscelides obtectus]